MTKLRHAMRSPENPVVLPAMPSREASQDQPLRLLLIRLRAGELPWLARAVADMMAPVEIIQVVGMGNALWRLGHERFDTVLLDPELSDPRVICRCREQIGDIAAVPVLDLADPSQTVPLPVKPAPKGPRRPAQETARDSERQTLRLPWQRRSRRFSAEAQPGAATG